MECHSPDASGFGLRLIENPSEERCWTSQYDRNKESPQQRPWGIENGIKKGGRKPRPLFFYNFSI
ncbi:MAG: hypothetical protein A2W05_00285 [Candidatus Schekmanbacteria bacterium RBG_16_38_10]|uniref:Uncharacterized protein n=1 Tax=Candidatus Schekmanbacteria bacterium RBG_16_38_10 TaxID=1817879 RepID=A0A1F7RZ66_9BACT|nr:MAG: hypothetical protein A2W05_00285 [Candidatus Schekmanbacteria bacterium RBG_16_38_10]